MTFGANVGVHEECLFLVVDVKGVKAGELYGSVYILTPLYTSVHVAVD